MVVVYDPHSASGPRSTAREELPETLERGLARKEPNDIGARTL